MLNELAQGCQIGRRQIEKLRPHSGRQQRVDQPLRQVDPGHLGLAVNRLGGCGEKKFQGQRGPTGSGTMVARNSPPVLRFRE